MVMRPRGSPGAFHSGTGAGAFTSISCCCTAAPITLAARLLPTDQVRCDECIVRSGL